MQNIIIIIYFNPKITIPFFNEFHEVKYPILNFRGLCVSNANIMGDKVYFPLKTIKDTETRNPKYYKISKSD